MLLAAIVLIALVGCPLGIVGVWRGAFSPPWFDQLVGPARIIGYSTWNANCPPFTGCDPTLHESYVIWLLLDYTEPSRSSQRIYRLARLPINHTAGAGE
ncbi:MAG: hypothetical protein ABIV47_00015 [Roseiflexaceae bacterium]